MAGPRRGVFGHADAEDARGARSVDRRGAGPSRYGPELARRTSRRVSGRFSCRFRCCAAISTGCRARRRSVRARDAIAAFDPVDAMAGVAVAAFQSRLGPKGPSPPKPPLIALDVVGWTALGLACCRARRQVKGGMRRCANYSLETITDAVLDQMATTADPRLKEIMASRSSTFMPSPGTSI